MQQTAYADTILLSTPCLADGTIVLRDGTPRRLLQWIWSVGAGRLVDGFRGTVWICHAWLAKHLGVKRGTLRQALTKLRRAGWIRDAITSDSDGHPCRGLCFANAADHGFANASRTDREQTANRPRTLHAPPSSLKLREVQSTPAQSSLPRDPRQSSLLGPSFDAPAQNGSENGKSGTIKRDPRLHEVAVCVDDYERLRYDQHPRRVRSKRDTPEARKIAVEAITLALERVVVSGLYETLEAIELHFRAVVELNWEGAERKAETWEWWTGSALWAPNSLERCLGWLEEERNWIYLERAAGRSEPPVRGEETEPASRTEGLSPAEQQAEYDARHGITALDLPPLYDPSKVTMSIGGHELTSFDGRPTSVRPGRENVVADTWEKLGDFILGEEESPEQRLVSKSHWSNCPDTGELLYHPEKASAGLSFEPLGKTEEELRRELSAKASYLLATTDEERDADAKAGRKPWEVG